MAYNYNFNPQAINQQPQQNVQQQQIPVMPPQQIIGAQNIQPLFPQPQGNVYNINSTLEVANVPVGAGVSVALCLPENTMYIKTMQNGNPMFYPYKILPFNTTENQTEPQKENNEKNEESEKFSDQLKRCFDRIEKLENQFSKIGKKKEDWDV